MKSILSIMFLIAFQTVYAVDKCSAIFGVSNSRIQSEFSISSSSAMVPFIVEQREYIKENSAWGIKAGDKYWMGRSWDYDLAPTKPQYVYLDPAKDAAIAHHQAEENFSIRELSAHRVVTKNLLEKRFEISIAEGKALNLYQGEGFKELNHWLRFKTQNDPGETQDRPIRNTIAHIDNVFNRLPGLARPIITYRGMPLRAGAKIPSVGEVIVDPGFVSTSGEKAVADVYVFGLPGQEYKGIENETFEKMTPMDLSDLHVNARASSLPKEGIRFVMHLPEGYRALTFYYFLYYSGSGVITKQNEDSVKTEAEVLLARNRAFKVIQVDSPELVSTKARDHEGEVTDAFAKVHTVHLAPL